MGGGGEADRLQVKGSATRASAEHQSRDHSPALQVARLEPERATGIRASVPMSALSYLGPSRSCSML